MLFYRSTSGSLPKGPFQRWEAASTSYLFDFDDDLGSVLSWLKKIPSPPQELIRLWEDYTYMSSFHQPVHNCRNRLEPTISAGHIVSPSPKLLQVVVAILFIGSPLRDIPALLDFTWDELRSIICSRRPPIAKDDVGLPDRLPQTSFPAGIFPWASRDVALRCIQMFKGHLDASGENEYKYALPLLIRLSPPCSVLHRELWSISPMTMFTNSEQTLTYHVYKWLEVRFKNI
ncbi:hypothetical protein B0H13DRAFT_1956356 [Mycena leptocephala]|nr:hypothetical protein B0H13DRAFT_1956356 [Mycena leptocephala]